MYIHSSSILHPLKAFFDASSEDLLSWIFQRVRNPIATEFLGMSRRRCVPGLELSCSRWALGFACLLGGSWDVVSIMVPKHHKTFQSGLHPTFRSAACSYLYGRRHGFQQSVRRWLKIKGEDRWQQSTCEDTCRCGMWTGNLIGIFWFW